MKVILGIAVLALSIGASPASAACVYNGIYYDAGAQLCFDGWVQECTVADYWSAIGMCNRPDKLTPQADSRPLSDQLFAIALGTQPDEAAPLSAIRR